MFTHDRRAVDLNGTWKFCPDPMQRCRRQQWWQKHPGKNDKFPCWDPAGLWEIQVPGTWKTQFEELKWYDGHATYMRDFEVEPPSADSEAFLVFDGIVYAAEIYLNGLHVAKREWGYSPFAVRVTDLLMAKNRLFVLVDNHLKADRVPGEIFDWNNDGGIIGGVKLVVVPRTYLSNFRVQTSLNPDDTVSIDVLAMLDSRDAAAEEEVTLRIPELKVEETFTAWRGEEAGVRLTLDRGVVDLWCPENPKLYRIELATRFETIGDDIGLREIRTEGRRILLNGEPVRLYGCCTHAEFKDTGRTATPAGIQSIVDQAKELGLNFLRCAHYPYSEPWGRALDRAGIMWWEEVPAYWLSNMADEGQTAKACGMMAETIRRDWNRASLIVWSVSNECCYRNPADFDDNNYAYWFTVVPLVRDLDPSRLVSCAEAGNMRSLKPVWDPTQGDVFTRSMAEDDRWTPGHADAWYDLFDILAGNLYVQQAEDARVAYPRFVEMLKSWNKPLMLSEFGCMSLRGSDAPADTLGSEAFHAHTHALAYEVFADLPELVGYCPWCLTDIRVPIHWRWYNSGKGVFRYGFLDENYVRKETVFNGLKDSIAKLKQHWHDNGGDES